MTLLIFQHKPLLSASRKTSYRKLRKTLGENTWSCLFVMSQQHWKDPDFLLLGISCTHNTIKQSSGRKKTFWLFPINKTGNLHLERCSGFKGQDMRAKSCAGRRTEIRSPGSLLRDFILSPWIHTRDGWGTHRELPVSWDLPHFSEEMEGKCSQTGGSLQVKWEVTNQGCPASTHQAPVAHFGKASPDCCH